MGRSPGTDLWYKVNGCGQGGCVSLRSRVLWEKGLERRDTNEKARGIVVWELGRASLFISHPPRPALLVSPVRVLLPSLLWAGDEAPVIHGMN